jgi:hypothetical protein
MSVQERIEEIEGRIKGIKQLFQLVIENEKSPELKKLLQSKFDRVFEGEGD